MQDLTLEDAAIEFRMRVETRLGGRILERHHVARDYIKAGGSTEFTIRAVYRLDLGADSRKVVLGNFPMSIW
jgi:hypothetical protein